MQYVPEKSVEGHNYANIETLEKLHRFLFKFVPEDAGGCTNDPNLMK
jgi:hypothetical protein